MNSADLSLLGGAQAQEFFQNLGKLADEIGTRAYLIGGAVRDLLLGKASQDIDVMLECRLGEFIEHLQNRWKIYYPRLGVPGHVTFFKKYLTAKVSFPDAPYGTLNAMDFSQARKEVYESSGAPPLVFPGDLSQDLMRRDFSINALALDLTPSSFGRLVDGCEGRNDLKQKQIKILHESSFADDPARLIRAVRFAARLSFHLEAKTGALFQEAVTQHYIARLSPARLFDEFKKALSENDPNSILSALNDCSLLDQIIPGTPGAMFLEARDRQLLSQFAQWEILFAKFVHSNPAPKKLVERFLISKKDKARCSEIATHFGV